MTHNKMRHHLFQRALPFAGCTWTGTAVWTELACILVICLLRMHQRDCAATGGVFAGEHHVTRHFFHSQVTDVTCNGQSFVRYKSHLDNNKEKSSRTQGTPACRATGEFRSAIRAD